MNYGSEVDPEEHRGLVFVLADRQSARQALRDLLREWDAQRPDFAKNDVVAVERVDELLSIERNLERAAQLIVVDLPLLDLAALEASQSQLHTRKKQPSPPFSHTAVIAMARNVDEVRDIGPLFAVYRRPARVSPSAFRNAVALKSGRSAFLESVSDAIFARG